MALYLKLQLSLSFSWLDDVSGASYKRLKFSFDMQSRTGFPAPFPNKFIHALACAPRRVKHQFWNTDWLQTSSRS